MKSKFISGAGWLVVAAGTLFCFDPVSPAQDARIGDVTPVMPGEKLGRALDGTFDFPPSPPSPCQPDARGFASNRLFHVPPVGVHPRILFAPEDLPRLRMEIKSNACGVGLLAALRAELAKGIGTKGTWEQRCFAALVAGDLENFKTNYIESPLDDSPPGSGFRSHLPGREPASKWGMRNPLLASLEAKAWLALLDDDAASGREVANALTAYAEYVSPKVDAANLRPRHEFHWYSTRYLVPDEIAYGYDWTWKWMTPAQRETVRSLIVRATAGKYTLGMDLPAHWRNWNHLGMTDSYAACLFAIEGEPGDDPRGRDRIYEVYRDYLNYGIDNLGSGTEGIGYQTAGFGHLSAPLLAFANRGKNLLVHPHWRRMTESWLVQTMQPFGGAWQSSGDLGNMPPNLQYLLPQKYYFSDSPGIDFVLRNQPQIAKKDWAAIANDASEVVWLLPCLPAATDSRAAAQQEAAALVGGGLTYYDRQRGWLVTRTGWGSNDLVLHVDCRTDTTFANHDHADRGQFTFAALGRAWACDGYRDTESKFHNVVTIDGRGQGYFTPPGDWISKTDDAAATTAAVDAKYCWDWLWTKSTFTESRASLARRDLAGLADAAERQQARIPLKQWQPEPTPKVAAYYQGFADRAHGDPRMWDDEDGWVLRAPWFPVQKAFRTVVLARGKHPYVLVLDDIRKDDAEHLYEWRMNMPSDIETVSINGNDILLGDATTHRERVELDRAFQGKTGLAPAKGDRLLLVRTLDIAGPDLPTLQPPPVVAKLEYRKTDDMHQFTGRSMGMGTQAIIGSRSAEPKFLIMLYPHRQGDELPTTTWDDAHTKLTVTFSGQKDEYLVTQTADGRRQLERRHGSAGARMP